MPLNKEKKPNQTKAAWMEYPMRLELNREDELI